MPRPRNTEPYSPARLEVTRWRTPRPMVWARWRSSRSSSIWGINGPPYSRPEFQRHPRVPEGTPQDARARSGYGHHFQQPGDEIVRRDALRLGLKGEEDTVAQHLRRHLLDVLGPHGCL